MRNAGQHDGAVLFDLGQALRHAVEADVDLADFAGVDFFAQAAGTKIALLYPAGSKRKFLEGAVDQARNQRSTRQRQRCGHRQPDHPGFAATHIQACRISAQPVFVALDVKADPHTALVVDTVRNHRVFTQPATQAAHHIAKQRVRFC